MSNPIPDDGGPYHSQYSGKSIPGGGVYYEVSGGCSLRTRLAMQFAAAWLPIVSKYDPATTAAYRSEEANRLGLAMADDLIKRLREPNVGAKAPT